MRAVLLVVLLLAACTGASPSPSPSAEPVRVLGQGLWLPTVEHLGVAAATTQTEYDAMWADADRSASPPPVDFETEIALFLGMAGSSSCPEEFLGLVVDAEASLVHGSWRQRAGNVACTDDLQPQGVLLAVSRAALPPSQFLLSLREQAICSDCSDHPDQTVVTL